MPRQPESGQDLHALQASFGQSIRISTAHVANSEDMLDSAVDDVATAFGEGLEVYRNNAWQAFLTALERTFTVTKRRVGDEFFRQLAQEYRARHPSRQGDLHWIGAAFPAWLTDRLAATGYEWLGDLARLEWACEEAATAVQTEPVGVDSLSRFDANAVSGLALALQPSLRFVTSPFPIWSVWQSNQDEGVALPVDLAIGTEHCVVACVAERVAVYRLDPVDHCLLQRLAEGMTLADAIAAASTDAAALVRLLEWAFLEGLVVQVVSPSVPV